MMNAHAAAEYDARQDELEEQMNSDLDWADYMESIRD